MMQPSSRRILVIAGYLAAILVGSAAPARAQWSPPLWTRGATCYEVFVRSFYDSNGDGIGDIPGLIAKLDYINDGNPSSQRSLGARCIWLMPVAESPSYHGYDVTDYYRVERDYGTNDDFKRLVAEAHRRGIKVLVDMVLNHASSEHPWFQAALRDPASPYRAWFRWSPTKRVEKNWGSEVWHHSPVRDEYYYGLFWGGMPDLNYTNPPVMIEAKKVAQFWLQDMGVDGFRLDAVPYLVEEGDQVAHSSGTHAVLRDYGAYVRSVKPDAYTIGEVTYPNDILLTYYPEQLDSYFAFEVADSIISAVRAGSAKGLLAPLLRLQGDIPANRWSPFLRNHDQPRTRTELGGDRARARIASFLLLTMPGVPFVYYGEEIGMIGAKPDERLRTPMQWSTASGAGFTRGRPWERLQDDSLSTTVEAQDKDPSSLLALHRRLIHLRDANAALGTGELVPLTASDSAVAAYLRRDGDRAVLVVANLSRTPLRGVSLTSRVEALRRGHWTTRNMLDRSAVAPLSIADDGQLHGYVPLATLAPLEGYLIELSPPSDARR
jgi:alpha-amylase